MVQSKTVYGFKANLRKVNGQPLDTYQWPFYVLAKTQGKARQLLEEYLTHPEKTGLKYDKCVGIREMASETVIMEVADEPDNKPE